MSDLTNTFRVFFPSSSFRASGLIAAFAFLICLNNGEKRQTSMKVIILTICLLAFLFSFSTAAFAVDFTVNVTTDQHDASTADGFCDFDTVTAGDQCSLRAAVEQANALPSNDRVLFSLPANSTITLTTANGGEIPITFNGTLEIAGTGANNLTIDGGAGTNRIFFSNNTTVTISGMTLTGGNGEGAFFGGGAILFFNGALTLDSVYVTGNSTVNSGGGLYIYNTGTHRIINSTFSNNNSGGFCGGIFMNTFSQYTLSVVNSTISGNNALNGSGGGGICNYGTMTLRSVTVTGNSASSGGGISNFGGTLNLGNTIVAGNTGGAIPDIRLDGGIITTAGYNLIGDNATVTATFPTGNPNANKDIVGTSAAPINPMLGPLTITNGGTTPTHALLFGSPALDKGNSFTLATDQRGFARPVDFAYYPNAAGGDGADIGAFERQAGTTAAAVSVSGRVMTASGRGIRNVHLTLTDSNGQIRTATTSSFGYYRFDDVLAGETYILSAIGKRYTFSQAVRVLSINDAVDAVDFIADSK